MIDDDDVFSSDMDREQLSDAQAEALFNGTIAGFDDPDFGDAGFDDDGFGDAGLGAFVAEAKLAAAQIVPGTPSAALREFLDVSPVPSPTTNSSPVQVIDLVADSPRPRRNRMIPAFATFVAYMLCGAYVTGVVSVPVLPELRNYIPPAQVVAADDGQTDSLASNQEPAIEVDADSIAALSTSDIASAEQAFSDDASNSTTPTTSGSSSTDADQTGSSSDDDDESDNSDDENSNGSGSDDDGSDDDESDDSDDDSDSDDDDSDDDDSDDSDDDDSDDDDSDDSDDDDSDDDDDSTSTSTTTPAIVADQSVPASVPGVLSVTVNVSGGVVTITNVVPASGWMIDEHYSTGDEAKVRVTDGSARVRIDAEIEDGLLRVRTRDERGDDRVESESNFDDGDEVAPDEDDSDD